ncbi:syntaxin-binding protein 5-like [Paramacrobiotus metropolitanus]|uniref:syntaxin-binding protein 5-like n=1 Tax=Paramacrobiotus metropolitanus TaxID=2943436 RepID=UPI002445D567|nr:syntaxin-binding protein 5-like [Paramacrobiotus metropolitanus]
MKKLTFRSMLDNLRSSVAGVADAVTGANKFDIDPDENVRPQDFAFAEVSRHGFPQDPTTMALEPVQRILAIGTRHGLIRLIGRPGVDYLLKPPSGGSEQAGAERDALLGNASGSHFPNAIVQIAFLVNEGTFVSLTANSWLHLWNYKSSKPDIVQSLEFQKEALTVCHVPYQSKWLFAGTDKGNVHIVQVDTFSLSGYIINWNKAMELTSRSHPGKVIHLSDCPHDNNKLLIGFETGLITLWDLKTKTAELRFQASETLCHISWHFDGKQFVSSHADGTLAVWNVKVPGKPTSITSPHSRRSKDDPVIPIAQVEWKKHKSGSEPLLLFSGGVSFEQKNEKLRNIKTQTMTIIHGKSTTVLEMEHPIVCFLCIPAQPWIPEGYDNEAVMVLLENDLVAIDLVTPGYPLYENPYPMDLHEPTLLHCHYVADCPTDIIPTLYTAGAKHKKSNFTNKDWPIDGGVWATSAMGYSDFLLTTHHEGTIRFWDVSSAALQHLDRLKISKIFERIKKGSFSVEPVENAGKKKSEPLVGKSSSSLLDGPFEIQMVTLDPECRYLAVACVGGLVILYLWNKQEVSSEISVLEIAIHYNSHENSTVEPPPPSSTTSQTTSPPVSSASAGGQNSLDKPENNGHAALSSPHPTRRIKVKPGTHRRAAGYQPVLVCFTHTKSSATSNDLDTHPATSLITSLAVSAKYGLLAIGNEIGLAVIDIIQKHCVMSIGTPDLYGSGDPYNRGSKSPKNEKASLPGNDQSWDPISDRQLPTTSPKHRPSSSAAAVEKTELSRSRSSSSSEVDVVTSEAILFLKFADTYGKKSEGIISPCLWIGTALGSVLVLTFQVPGCSSSVDPSQPQQTQRLSQPVIGTPTGTLFRYNNSGAVITIGFLDARGAILGDSNISPPPSASSTKDDPKSSARPSDANAAAIPPLANLLADSRHILVICMERQIRTFILPHQGLYQKLKLTDQNSNNNNTFLKASVERIKDNACIFTYMSAGRIAVFSLPTLKPLLDVNVSQPNDLRMARTLSFSEHGNAVYLVTKSELQKVTFAAETAACLNQLSGCLYSTREVVETSSKPSVVPSVGFFKGLMSTVSTVPTLSPAEQLAKDREELFGDAAGKGSRALARHVPGTSAIDQARISSQGATSEISRAKMLALERGEKLSELEDRAEQMRMQAEAFAGNAHQLASKYKDKKWYKM